MCSLFYKKRKNDIYRKSGVLYNKFTKEIAENKKRKKGGSIMKLFGRKGITLLTSAAVLTLFGGISVNAADVVLEVETSWTGTHLEVLQGVMDSFTEETGIGVELISPGEEYENVMKTRMASGDLPDLFETHGWSLQRYAEYLAPVNDLEWFDQISDAIKGTVTADDGSVYVLPLSLDPASICYNKEVFEVAGVEPGSIRTWADFEDACAKIKEAGKVPVYVGGKTVDNTANLIEVIAPGFLTNDDVEDNQGAALLDGTFDFETYWTPMVEMLQGWMVNGYFNQDILTASNDSAIQAIALGECGFVISGNHTITQALEYNPDAKLGIMAVPSNSEEGVSYVSSGEGTCYGMWKDSEYQEECKQLLAYLARPENCELIASTYGKIPGLKGITNEDEYVTKEFNEMQNLYEGDLTSVQYFDREFFPSGMWNDMGVSTNEMLMDPEGDGVAKCVEAIKTAYTEKYGQ